MTHLSSTRSSLSFDVSRVGVPVVINASYFPWWRVSGASGPWRIAPNAMVIVPTRHHVTATVGPRTVDAVARGISAVGIAGVVALLVVDRRRRQDTKPVDPAVRQHHST